MSDYKTHPFYTHQPFVKEVLKTTNGNILECGCGDGSTSLFKSVIHGTNRKLVSLESNLEWLNKFTHLESDNHKLFHVNASNEDTLETGNKWVEIIKEKCPDDFEVVFIDSSPWISRKCVFDYFKDKAKIIIIHDFDYYVINNIIGKLLTKENHRGKMKITCDLSSEINNSKLFYPPLEYFAGESGPPTLICSNLMEKEEFDMMIKNIEVNAISYY